MPCPRLSQAQLDIGQKVRKNLFPWRGQFSPQLVEAHLTAYAPRSQAVILDPFVGSGTVLVEAARLGHVAIGAEVNPAAATLAATYSLVALPRKARARLLDAVATRLATIDLDEDLPTFDDSLRETDLREALIGLWRAERAPDVRRLLEVLVVVLDYGAGPVVGRKVRSTWSNLRRLVEGLPNSPHVVGVALADARALPIPDGTVDLVITSPPYINVFNYHQQYRASIEALDWEVLALATSEIGANRKHRANRLLTVVQYCLDMALVLAELCRVCRPGARAILVVGRESNVRKTAFWNGEILKRIAQDCIGLHLLLRQERTFVNRFGQSIREDILHLQAKQLSAPPPLREVAAIARGELMDAVERAPADTRADFEQAIQRAYDVRPSPIVRGSDRFLLPPLGLL
jgi:SAM-dependent methyltransferase